jgi:hypothetical protein
MYHEAADDKTCKNWIPSSFSLDVTIKLAEVFPAISLSNLLTDTHVDFSLTKEQIAFRHLVREFARAELNPDAAGGIGRAVSPPRPGRNVPTSVFSDRRSRRNAVERTVLRSRR